MKPKKCFEKHICQCGKVMKEDGFETFIMSPAELPPDPIIEEICKMVADLEVYICENCDYKIWIYNKDSV